LGVVRGLKHENGYLVSVSSDMSSEEKSCLTVREMKSPQNISVGICVSLNGFVYGMDFNEKYITVLLGRPPEDNTRVIKRSPLYDSDNTIYDIQIFSLSTIQFVRTMTNCSPFTGSSWQMLRNLIILGSTNETIRQLN
jgi:hypothetical protein